MSLGSGMPRLTLPELLSIPISVASFRSGNNIVCATTYVIPVLEYRQTVKVDVIPIQNTDNNGNGSEEGYRNHENQSEGGTDGNRKKRGYKRYTEYDMVKAIEAVRNGMVCSFAAQLFCVPRRTLYIKFKKSLASDYLEKPLDMRTSVVKRRRQRKFRLEPTVNRRPLSQEH